MSTKIVIPLATLTAAGLLATDMVLPALPDLRTEFDGTLSQSQSILALFFLGLALSQLFWGAILPMTGLRLGLTIGSVLFAATTLVCGTSETLSQLAMFRFAQGFSAGAFTVITPVALKQLLSKEDSLKAIAFTGMIEAISPALGPIIGGLIIFGFGWRYTFGVLFCITVVAYFVALISLPKVERPKSTGSYVKVLTSRQFMTFCANHIFSISALLLFVSFMPEVLAGSRGATQFPFQILQVTGVVSFIVGAILSPKLNTVFGTWKLLRTASLAHVLLVGVLMAWESSIGTSFIVLIVFWSPFCMIMGIRGPVAFSEALSVPQELTSRASALIILASMVAVAASVQIVSMILPDANNPMAIWFAQLLLCICSAIPLWTAGLKLRPNYSA